jgi:hypothetical protein
MLIVAVSVGLQLQLLLWTNVEVVTSFYLTPRKATSNASSLHASSSHRSSISSQPPPTSPAAAVAALKTTRIASTTNDVAEGELLGQTLILDNYILPSSHPLHFLLSATSAACSFEDAIARTSSTSPSSSSPTTPSGIDNNDDNNTNNSPTSEVGARSSNIGEVNAHESFRYEWGTWLSSEKLGDITTALGEMRLITGGLDTILSSLSSTVHHPDEGNEQDALSKEAEDDGKERGKRIRIAGGKYWDIILHDLPRGA